MCIVNSTNKILKNDHTSASVEVLVGLGHEVVHHHTVPQLGVVADKPGVRGYLHPVVVYHVAQRFIASQGGQAPLPGKVLDLIDVEIFHAVPLECQILLLNLYKFLVDLPDEPLLLQDLKGEVVEFEYPKILLDPPGVLVGRRLHSFDLIVQVPGGLVDEPPGQHRGH